MSRRRRILLTGMSGVGKSAVARQLADGKTLCIGLDGPGWRDEFGCLRTAEILRFMDAHTDMRIVLVGCEYNQAELYPALDAVLLLTAPLPVMRARILARANSYGKTDAEWQCIVENKRAVEPLIARNCTAILRTDRPLADVVKTVRSYLEG